MIDKTAIKQTVDRIVGDKPILWLSIAILILCVVCSLIVGFNIHASDVTVYSRYTAFGEAHFYKSHWQYLLLFIVFNVAAAIGHIAIMAKLHTIERRQTALLVGWVAIVILVVATVYALSVMQLGQAA